MAARKKIFKYIVMAVVFALIFLTIILVLKKILPGFMEVLEGGSETSVQDYIRGFGTVKGVFIGILLQFMQIVSIVFPGGPIQISAGIIFGTWLGFGICFVGYVSANCAVFYVARSLGEKINDWMPIEEEESASKLNFISRIKSPVMMVLITCMMPFMPNGIVPYLAAKTDIKFKDFFLAVSAGCAPTLLLLCAAGSKVLKGNYLEAGIYGVLLVACVVLLTVKQKAILALAEKIRLKLKRDDGSGK